ncbi:MAG: ComF family protein [Planctomycetia bacterium]|nr:ComF family protein [Planctomycetia bacterium]
MALVEVLRREGARWAGRSVDLLFPPRCGLCLVDLPCTDSPPRAAGGRCGFCGACAAGLAADVDRCRRCGEAAAGEPPLCRRCRTGWRDWDGIAVLGGYGDGLRDAILRSKRPAGEGIPGGLASLIVARHGARIAGWAVDAVVPVPMHWLRRAARGTSAADELARRIAGLLAMPFHPVLVRRRATPMQNELPAHRRRDNVRNAFRARRRLDGRRVLLVDDVVTTGATLAACRRELAAAGAAAVFAVVAAKADRSAVAGDA